MDGAHVAADAEQWTFYVGIRDVAHSPVFHSGDGAAVVDVGVIRNALILSIEVVRAHVPEVGLWQRQKVRRNNCNEHHHVRQA
jgi:hypothetical protein